MTVTESAVELFPRPRADVEADLAHEPQRTLLIVDAADINRRVLRGMLKVGGYRMIEARGSVEAFQILEQESVDLIVVDLMMPEISGAQFCARLKANRRTHLTPILMLSSIRGSESEIAGISSGADEFLLRPLHPDVTRARVRAMLRNKAAIDSLDEAEAILFSLAQAVEGRDKCTGDHCERLARFSMALGTAIGLSDRELQALHRGGYLHDIGKVCVPDAVLYKPGPLDDTEWTTMRTHTTRGEEICKPMRTLADVLPIIRSHHERYDGSGYPDGMRGEEIPLLARILQVVDIYDALTSARPYKNAFSQEQAFAILNEETSKGWRDPELVPLFQECMAKAELWNSLGGGEPGVDTFQRSLTAMRRFLEE